MIENLKDQHRKICDLIRTSLLKYTNKRKISDYNITIIKSGIERFTGEKSYLDTSSVEGINNINNSSKIYYESRPSRANMQPVSDSVWFARMKGSNKILIITSDDKDILRNNILSTGFLGLKANDSVPLSFLTAIIISYDFAIQRDLNSVGTTMAGVNNDSFLNILVPWLTKSEIANFDSKNKHLISQLSLIRKKIDKLQKIKRSLLQRFF